MQRAWRVCCVSGGASPRKSIADGGAGLGQLRSLLAVGWLHALCAWCCASCAGCCSRSSGQQARGEVGACGGGCLAGSCGCLAGVQCVSCTRLTTHSALGTCRTQPQGQTDVCPATSGVSRHPRKEAVQLPHVSCMSLPAGHVVGSSWDENYNSRSVWHLLGWSVLLSAVTPLSPTPQGLQLLR